MIKMPQSTSPNYGFSFISRIFATFLIVLSLGACNKIGSLPIPGGILPYGVVTPVQQFITTYNVDTNQTQPFITLVPEVLNTVTTFGTTYQQAELGFAFRTSIAGSVFALGFLEPDSSYVHTVTLWDSATQTILAQKNIYNLSGITFTYDTLSPSEVVVLQPNHGYVLGINSLGVNNLLNAYNAGNLFYFVGGITDYNPAGNPFTPITPFTEGTITVETGFVYNYGTQAPPANLFPPNFGISGNALMGLCDIGFAP